MPTPYPYSFCLRYGNQTSASNIGFINRKIGTGVGNAWAEQLFGAIPNRLSSGVPDLNDTSNVNYFAWENLANGGIGAYDASDPSRYRFGIGAYTGDVSEIYLQPAATELLNAATGPAVPLGQKIKQIIPWYIPGAQQVGGQTVTGVTATGFAGGSLTASATYSYQITGMTGSVESVPSANVDVTLGAGQNSVHLLWNRPAGSSYTSYRVYRGLGSNSTSKMRYFEVAGATVFPDSGSGYRVIDNGTTAAGTAISTTQSALAPNAVRKIIILADDGTNTYLYELPYNGTGINGVNTTFGSTVDTIRQTMTPTGTVGVYTKGLTDATSTAIADNTLVTSISGVLAYNACTIYYDHLLIPTTNTAGTQVVRHLYYDNSATHPGLQISDLGGQIGSRVFGESTTRLWLFSNNLAYWCAEPYATTPTWNGPIPVGDRNTPINSALMHGGTMINDAALYLAKPDGLFRILDTDQGPQTRAERVGALGMVDDNNGSFMCNHRGELYIGGRHVVFRYTIGQVDNSGPNKNLGLCPSLITTFYDGVSTGRHFYALGSHLNNVSGTSSVLQTPDPFTGSLTTYYGYQQIFETSQGEAWTQFHHSCASSTTFSETVAPVGERWTGRSMEIITSNVANDYHGTLIFTGGDGCNRIFTQPLRNHDERIREAPTYVPVPFARLRFPQYYTEHARVDKLWQWVEVWQSPLTNAPNASLKVFARLYNPDRQPDATATNVTYATGVGADATTGRFYPIAGADATIYPTGDNTHRNYLQRRTRTDGRPWVGKGIDLELQFTSSSDNRTPVFSALAVTYGEGGLALHRWTFNIEIAKGMTGEDGNVPVYSGVSGVPNMDLKTTAGVLTYVNNLYAMAQNRQGLILTDPFGGEYPVRIDLSPMSWTRWQNTSTGPQPDAGVCTMTVTQLFVP